MRAIIVAIVFVVVVQTTIPIDIFSNFNIDDFANRDVAPRDSCSISQSTPQKCSTLGGRCSTSCTSCKSPFNKCVAIAVAANDTSAECDCHTNYVNCLAAAKDVACPSSFDVYQTCTNNFSFCGCGTYSNATVAKYSCYTNLFCNDTLDTCVPKSGEGEYCRDWTQCGNSSLEYSAASWTCTNNVTKFKFRADNNSPGSTCANDSQCARFSTLGLGCVNQKCAFQVFNESCSTSTTCETGLYCDSNKLCQYIVPIGENCTYDYECGSLNACNVGKCAASFSLGNGTACKNFDSGETLCKPGLYCSGIHGVCLPIPVSGIACNTTDDCLDINEGYTGCVCNGTQQVCNPPQNNQIRFNATCVELYLELSQCDKENRCQLNQECIAEYCLPEFTCYYLCYVDVIEKYNGIKNCVPGKCAALNPPILTTSSTLSTGTLSTSSSTSGPSTSSSSSATTSSSTGTISTSGITTSSSTAPVSSTSSSSITTEITTTGYSTMSEGSLSGAEKMAVGITIFVVFMLL